MYIVVRKYNTLGKLDQISSNHKTLHIASFTYYLENQRFLPPETEQVNLSIEPSL